MEINSKYIAAVQKHGGNPTAFFNALDAMAKRLGIPVLWIANVMWIECQFNHKAVNSAYGATGLIQFVPSSAIGVGTTTTALRSMTNVQQLVYVEKYFKNQVLSAGKPKDWFETYLLVFHPYWVGKTESTPLKGNSSAYKGGGYEGNKYIDLNKDGFLTKGEFRTWANKQLPGGAIETIKKPPFQ